MIILKEKIKKFPKNPGIYIFRDKSGLILYVGKATDLQSRVLSYFRGENRTERPIEAMIGQVEEVEIQETDSVLEALILESNLIKKFQPKYNAMGKDDKSFSYFAITKEEFPKVLILRKTELEGNMRSRRENSGQIENLKNRKEKNLKYPQSKIYGPYTSKKQMEIALKIMRKIFPFHLREQKTEKGCLDFQIGLCSGPYANAISKTDYGKNIRGIKMILEGKKKRLLGNLKKEMEGYSRKKEFEKAAEIRNKIFALRHIRDVALIAKEEFNEIGHKRRTRRIEAYDISNISGQYAVGGLVVFHDAEPEKSQYRKFRIKTVAGPDDVGMMEEVLVRRFKNDWPNPDLILLDGGRGHLNMARKILRERNLKIPVMAAAKGKNRKNLRLICDSSQLNEKIQSELKNKQLIKKIMDEAHRFAIAYHKKVRKNHFLEKK